MNPNNTNSVVIKDLVFNLQSYVFWLDEFHGEETWSALHKANNFYARLKELLPQALKILKSDDFDALCG